jgi:hypothetical protein
MALHGMLAIREVFTWLGWLATAPEEEGDEDD